MLRKSFLLLALMAAGVAHGAGPDAAAKAKYQAAAKAANVEYSADKKLCAEQATAADRMQCLKDAKSKYTASVKAAQNEMKSGAGAIAAKDLGKVLSVNVGEKAGDGSAVGVIAGGVAGALLGNQVGGGTGKDLATIAGAVGGAYAGNKLEQKVKSTKVWTVAVKFGNGDQQDFTFDREPGFAAGDAVKRVGDSIARK